MTHPQAVTPAQAAHPAQIPTAANQTTNSTSNSKPTLKPKTVKSSNYEVTEKLDVQDQLPKKDTKNDRKEIVRKLEKVGDQIGDQTEIENQEDLKGMERDPVGMRKIVVRVGERGIVILGGELRRGGEIGMIVGRGLERGGGLEIEFMIWGFEK